MKKTLTTAMLMALVAPAWAMDPAPAAPVAPAAPAKPASAPAPGRSDAAAKEAAALEPAVQTSPAAGASPAQDRLELDTTQITGNRELPRVLYVVPWKRPDLGDLAGRPANSLLDEVLAPVDRDVFRRQNRYYQALKPDSASGASSTRAEGEK
jgi:hypothetical protein